FINKIAIRSQMVKNQSFAAFSQELLFTVVDGLDHSIYPFPLLTRQLNPAPTPANKPVFQVTFGYQNALQTSRLQSIPDRYQDMLAIEFVEDIDKPGEYGLEFEVFEKKDTFELNIKYNPGLYGETVITGMVEHYVKLAAAVTETPDLALEEYPLLFIEEPAPPDRPATAAEEVKEQGPRLCFPGILPAGSET
ncbi:MAG: hypothetical protein GY950_20410, partial [bacterium]|nr:hypothetical protein [bacterium]